MKSKLKENKKKRWITIRNLFASVGEPKSPGVVDEEHVGLRRDGVRCEDKASLEAGGGGLYLEEVSAVECLRGELLEQWAVQRLR